MTDTFSPITEPHPAPMFATGEQPALSPNTEPNPAPIFDTGPHPDPLGTPAPAAESTPPDEDRPPDEDELQLAEWDSDEWRYADWRHPDTEPAPESKPDGEPSEAEAEAEAPELPDAAASEPDSAGMAADLHLALDALDEPPAPAPKAFSELDNVDTDAFLMTVTGHMQPVVVAAQPVAVPSAFQFVKRWKFALILAGVWLVAAAAGLGFYYWWYTAMTKTIPVFGILLYLAVCMVASILVSMVPNRTQVTALSLALMAAPLASMAAAAVLHGAYYFEWIARPIIG